MKIRNSNFVEPAQAFINAHKAEIAAYLSNNAGSAFVTFDAVRAAHPAIAADLTDGMICAICAALGCGVFE